MSVDFQNDRVYVERLAIAPWNRPPSREARGVGAALVLHAVRRSFKRGRFGVLALHSLEDPKTIAFYRDRLNMVETRTEIVDGQNLRYFELSAKAAAALIGGAP
jgi:phosphoglycerol transferase MdoB-like AlkP superfamily enzyme